MTLMQVTSCFHRHGISRAIILYHHYHILNYKNVYALPNQKLTKEKKRQAVLALSPDGETIMWRKKKIR